VASFIRKVAVTEPALINAVISEIYSLTNPKISFVKYLSKSSGLLTNSGPYNANSGFTKNHSHQQREIKRGG
jgi:hypothetical protein